MDYPSEIDALHRALSSLAGVSDVCSGIDNLQVIVATDLSFPDYRHLPHAALLRTGGGLESEALIQFEFRLEPSEAGWHSLEFLAWFVRDRARGGQAIQLRPFALPPVAGELVQLGSSLRFHLDVFCAGVGEDLGPQFQHIQKLADGLVLAIDLYERMLQRRGQPGLRATIH
jgi:hypothetical protein